MTNSFPEDLSKLKVSLSHDWLTGMRGGERVLEILCDGFPEAKIYTLISNADSISDTIKSHEVITSGLQLLPGVASYYRNLLPLFPLAIEGMKVKDTNLLISTSHCVAKGLITPKSTKHLCYCFTPMRYAWTFFDEYFGTNPVKGALVKPLLASLRKWDKNASGRVDSFVAISKHVQKRIKDFYGRDSDIVYPPVDTDRCRLGNNTNEDFDLIVSALVPYKRVDLAVSAYTKLGFPLKVVGIGGDLSKLQSMAGENVEFLQWQSDEEIIKLYQSCRMLVFPGEEDFGIVPVEVQACGRPVVAYGKGGALETVKDGVSGVFFDSQDEESLIDGVEKCAKNKWNKEAIRNNAEKFSTSVFIEGISKCVNDLVNS